MSRVFHRVESIDNPGADRPAGDLAASPRRRDALRRTATALTVPFASRLACGFPPAALAAADSEAGARIGFRGIPISSDDAVRVPEGYTASVLIRWGDPIGDPRGMPAFAWDASNSADEQALQSGTHHDGMVFFGLPQSAMPGQAARYRDGANPGRGLLAMNHEYPDYGTLFPDHTAGWSREKVRKAQYALGVSVIEIELRGDRWQLVAPSKHARRIHAGTPMRVGGPAAGHALMRTRASPSGRESYGTFANCAAGWTPWGTYLSCEENFHTYFKGREKPTPHEARYGISARSDLARWGEADPRFDVTKDPNEPNHFGWVVEIDPYDPMAKPVKRTALGRKKQEGAAPAICRDGRVAFYMGDDQVFEYLYKFVTAKPWNPEDRRANRDLLDEGTLYAARFDASGDGEWLELAYGRNGLVRDNGFASQADVLIKARQAADRAGATPLDRPEWTAVDPLTGAVCVSLTHNRERGKAGRPGADAVNPRAPNLHGHIVRWVEAGGDHAATSFRWEILAFAGEPNSADPTRRGDIVGDLYASPDGLLVDPRGVIWVQTDVSASALLKGEHAAYGNNQMLAIDPVTRETRRFLTGPRGCEITGACLAPDSRTMFVNIQHPGETRDGVDPKDPRKMSNWPDFRPDGRPRSATVVIRKDDGGIIGT